MNPKLAAMGIILSSARPDAEFRGRQTEMFQSILDPYSVEVIEKATEEHVSKFCNWPMTKEGLDAFKAMLKKHAGQAAAGPPSRKIHRTWSEAGDYTGDWSSESHESLTWHYAMISRFPFECNLPKVAEFRSLCLRKGIPLQVLEDARAAARIGNFELTRYMEKLKAKHAA